MANWRDWLGSLRRRVKSSASTAAESTTPQATTSSAAASTRSPADEKHPGQPPVAINLGIDFGTSFTKVCFRDQATDHSSLVAFGAEPEAALVPSVVHVDDAGGLYIEPPHAVPTRTVRYLKMRLAGVPLEGLLPDDLADADRGDVCKALSSWFLATVIARSRAWIEQHYADRLRNRRVEWSANVGVPVEHCDSPMLRIFEEVLKVAWHWSNDRNIPKDVQAALAAYAVTREAKQPADFHPVPEIAAAVQSFVISQAAAPGIYVYFDVGGGTVDGVAFRLRTDNGQKQVDFYSGKVSPLGTVALARGLDPAFIAAPSWQSLQELLRANPRGAKGFEEQMHRLVAYVVVTGKLKDGRNWKEEAIQDWMTSRNIQTLGRPDVEKPLVVFVGGGGASIRWYEEAIHSTYHAFQHGRAGIPVYHVQSVPKPADFRMPSVKSELFDRFSIAYGLSVPVGEGPHVRLPSQIDPPLKREPKRPPGLVDYHLQSKDAWQ